MSYTPVFRSLRLGSDVHPVDETAEDVMGIEDEPQN